MIGNSLADSLALQRNPKVHRHVNPHLGGDLVAVIGEAAHALKPAMQVPEELGGSNNAARWACCISPLVGLEGREVGEIAVGEPGTVGVSVPAILSTGIDLGPGPREVRVLMGGEEALGDRGERGFLDVRLADKIVAKVLDEEGQ